MMFQEMLRIDEIRSWAGQLASETRGSSWIREWYVLPASISTLLSRLEIADGAVIGLVGLQGVGKSSALQAIYAHLSQTSRKETKLNPDDEEQLGVVHFKWRREDELFEALLNGTHEYSEEFQRNYGKQLFRDINSGKRVCRGNFETRTIVLAEKTLEKMMGKGSVRRVRRAVWFGMLRSTKTILIDTKDYSKSDRRPMDRDLSDIQQLWCDLNSCYEGWRPNFVVAIQEEMFRGHFFFDKMEKIQLKPLEPEIMIEAYFRRFRLLDPFTEKSLYTLARMSSGIFRRFLRYISLTLDFWQVLRNSMPIDPALVRRAVPVERLAEDMELQLSWIFPRNSRYQTHWMELWRLLEERGPQLQSKLAKELGLEAYDMTRFVSSLEIRSQLINRKRLGRDMLISLADRSKPLQVDLKEASD